MEYPTLPPRTDDFDALLPILADPERRRIITYLQAAPTETASLDELTAHLATDTDHDSEHTRIRLHHKHLPTLAATTILDYDTRTSVIRYEGHSELEALLDTIRTRQSP